jgi:hypothetical protein
MATQGREIDEDDQRRIRKLARDFPASAGRGRTGGIRNAARIVGVSRNTAKKYAQAVEIDLLRRREKNN